MGYTKNLTIGDEILRNVLTFVDILDEAFIVLVLEDKRFR